MSKRQKCAKCGVSLKSIPWFGVVIDGKAARICAQCQKRWEVENVKGGFINRMCVSPATR